METLKLPVSNFAWLTTEDIRQMTSEHILNLPEQDDIGYAFEVDLHYPNYLHKVIKKYDFYNMTLKSSFFYYSIMISFPWHHTLEI